MELTLKAYSFCLKFTHPFGIAHGTRNSTDTLFVTASFDGKTGYGEAGLPPYLGYDVKELVAGFNNWFPKTTNDISAITEVLSQLNKSNNSIPTPVKTATDIALLDLWGKLSGKPIRDLLGIPPGNKTLCTFTLGISSINELIGKINEAPEFRLFKLKLGGENDHEQVEAFLKNSKHSFCVDANQAWKKVDEALNEIDWLKEKGCIFVEQPLPVSMNDEMAELHSKSSLPIILDESIQNIRDLENLYGVCHGINVKLTKCGGINPAMELIRRARKLNKKILVGCMSESSCGAAAASQLAGWADWVDLDGPKLISNDPFAGIIYQDGVLLPNTIAGLGITIVNDFTEIN